jgi:radical SAM superfamily enzyme YgiQ (UPF0313 family)
MKIVLISTYELGRQPFGLASPAAWLRERGHSVFCLDLSREPLSEQPIREADLIAFYVPMHTATRLAIEIIGPVRVLNPHASLCFYGLYAPVNETYLRGLGVNAILGGEFESGLVSLADRLAAPRQGSNPTPNDVNLKASDQDARRISASHAGPASATPPVSALPARHSRPASNQASPQGSELKLRQSPPSNGGASAPEDGSQPEPVIFLGRQKFLVPDRTGLPPLDRYAHLTLPDGRRRVVGYTEASRGCKHRCRHCPVVPVYNGVFRIVPPEIVLEDIRRQVRDGARHITFGDPDFFNGPRHALAIVNALHGEFPDLTYDATIKIEHLLDRRADLPVLRDTGCLFVTTAVESLDDAVLARLEKGHTRADFFEVARMFREIGLALHPTFIPFTPWTTLDSYVDLLDTLESLDLAENVAPVQLSIRLLVPAGSRLLELDEIRGRIGPFDAARLVYPWRHGDSRVDRLQREIESIVKTSQSQSLSRREAFSLVRGVAAGALDGGSAISRPADNPLPARASIPYLTEPWYC